MTVLIPSHTDADDAVIQPITFILADRRLVTIRYSEPRAFASFPQRAEKTALGLSNGESILLGLLEFAEGRAIWCCNCATAPGNSLVAPRSSPPGGVRNSVFPTIFLSPFGTTRRAWQRPDRVTRCLILPAMIASGL